MSSMRPLLDQLARFSDKERETGGRSSSTAPGHSLTTCAVRPHQEIVTTSEVIIREGVPHEVILERLRPGAQT